MPKCDFNKVALQCQNIIKISNMSIIAPFFMSINFCWNSFYTALLLILCAEWQGVCFAVLWKKYPLQHLIITIAQPNYSSCF